MKRKILSLALALCLCAGLLPTAAALKPTSSANAGRQNYSTWSSPVKSYLYDNGNGLTRVEYISGKVVVENYSASFEPLDCRVIDPELPIFGGFFAGETYNFLIFGQDNVEEDNSKEVIRVVQYDKEWNRLEDTGLFGANTTHPFDAGSLRCGEYGGYLYVRTCHEMYTTSDGLNHQANVTFCVREKDMTITDSFYEVMNVRYGYVSHSFNQFILVNQDGTIAAADHGDAHPRSIVLMTYPGKAGGKTFVPDGFETQTTTIDLVKFPGKIGQNSTGASLGGLAETESGYVAAYNWNGEDGTGNRDVYLAYVEKDMKHVKTARFEVPDGAQTPQLAPVGLQGGYLLWSGKDGLHYASYDAQGNVGQAQTATGTLSDCAPIPWQDGVVWYATSQDSGGMPVFYTLNDSGVTAHPVIPSASSDSAYAKPADTEPAGIAYASTQSVNVDGRTVTFECYALKDENGNLSNYIKLRDLAMLLNGTAAQFSVGWDGAVTITTNTAYTPNGSEFSTPYSGDRAYTEASVVTKVNGQAASLNAFVLTDDAGGGFTYYQLRDLGQALGFNVGWSAGKGIFLETNHAYDPAN